MQYVAPTSVEEAAQLLSSSSGARVFAGATDLIPQLRSGRSEPPLLIDLKRIPRLVALSRSDGTWTIGAATPTARLTEDDTFGSAFPGLSEAAGLIGSDQIQNRASLGGNLCNGSPAADSVPAMVVNRVHAIITSVAGTRRVPVSDVVTGPGSTSLDAGELLVELTMDEPPARTADAYLRLTPRTEMDIAVVGAAARITLDADGRCSGATLALGAVAPTVVRVPEAEAALAGSAIDEVLDQVVAAASAACDPIDDKRGTIEYRRQVAGVLLRRAVVLAAKRAGANS